MVSYGFVCPYHCVGPIPYVYNFVVNSHIVSTITMTGYIFPTVVYVHMFGQIHNVSSMVCCKKTAIFMAQTIMIAASICLLVKSCKNLSFVWLQTPIFPCFSMFFPCCFRSRLATAAGRRGRSPSGRNARSPTASAILQGKSLRDGVLKRGYPFFFQPYEVPHGINPARVSE